MFASQKTSVSQLFSQPFLILFIIIFFTRIIRRIHLVKSNISNRLFFFSNVFTLFKKHSRIIVFTYFKNRMHQYYQQINTIRTFFCYSIVMKFVQILPYLSNPFLSYYWLYPRNYYIFLAIHHLLSKRMYIQLH